MYLQDSEHYRWHQSHYGHPSKVGFKDVIRSWQAERFTPSELLSQYRCAGAKYFMALANHHDNFDLWASRHQPWNSTRLGPMRDIIADWATAAREQGLPFGVSVHAAHAYNWLEVAQGADGFGPLAGVPYDGNLRLEQGAGTWWEGLDPQALYAQAHQRSAGHEDPAAIHKQWGFANGASIPSPEYCERFLLRTLDLIDQHQPELIYFDDTVLPLHPISDVGLRIAAHFYNSSLRRNSGRLSAVLFGKILNEEQKRCMVWDIERGRSNQIEALPWQTDTCLGDWHYRRSLFEERRYKSSQTVIRMLLDVVSKNGNLLLSVPQRGDGSIDSEEVSILARIGHFLKVNGEAIYGTRPWKVFGEGPASDSAAPLVAQGFNEDTGQPYSARDIRFTTKKNVLYASCLGMPQGPIQIQSLGLDVGLLNEKVNHVRLLGSDRGIQWQQSRDLLCIEPPRPVEGTEAVVFAITT
jgi:alpha-L-fucosidase